MARAARIKSDSGIYHVMIREINKQLILEDEEDNQKLKKASLCLRLSLGRG